MLRYSKRGARSTTRGVDADSDATGSSPRPVKPRPVKVELEREESDLTKRRHEAIVRKLLEEFDLEETKNKYRYGGDHSRVLEEPLGVPNGHHTKEKVKGHRRHVSGLNVTTMKDRKWNESYNKSITASNEEQCIKKENMLAQAEVVRIRKLKLEGILPLDDDADDTDILKHWTMDPHTHKWEEHILEPTGPSQNNHGHSNHGHTNNEHSNNEHTNHGHTNNEHTNHGHTNNGHTSHRNSHSNHGHSHNDHTNHSNHDHSNQDHHNHPQPGSTALQEHHLKQYFEEREVGKEEGEFTPTKQMPAVLIGDTLISKNLKQNLTDLYKEESLSGLYEAANKLVYTTHGGDGIHTGISVI